MPEQFEHDSEAFLAQNFLQIRSPASRDLCKALRKCAIKVVKIDLAEQLGVSFVSGRRSRRNFLSVHAQCWEF